MIAIAKIGGHQEIVKKGEKLEVDKLDFEVGKKTKFEVLLVSEENGENLVVGTPLVANAFVEAKIIEHGKGDKIRVFKMKPRKRYRRTIGHRQDYTLIEITNISIGAKKTEKPVKKVVEKKTTVKKVEKK
jgi:large subunit ribosomal protein L21